MSKVACLPAGIAQAHSSLRQSKQSQAQPSGQGCHDEREWGKQNKGWLVNGRTGDECVGEEGDECVGEVVMSVYCEGCIERRCR